jgi:hypothetical protein
LVCVVEKWVPQTRRRIDAFGWIDLLAIKDGRTLGVQTTTASNLAAHITKAEALEAYWAWLEAGNVAVFHGWRKRMVGKAARWVCNVRTFGTERQCKDE